MTTKKEKKLEIKRFFVKEGNPYKGIEWEKRSTEIKNDKGEIVFHQKDVKVPKSWSDNALTIVASKYFKENPKSPHRERGVDQLIDRAVNTVSKWTIKDKIFATAEDELAFSDELKYVLINQMGSFNSPVWFNVGIQEKPQVSACFIQSVDDTMESILGLTVKEGMLFKYGSGTGSNFSKIRSSKESINGGGVASGPVSFMKGYDAWAGVIKCLAQNEEVITQEGIKKISEIMKGDLILTHNGFREVSDIYDNGIRPTVRVITELGTEVRCTPEHKFMVRSKDEGLVWREAKDIKETDYLHIDLSAKEFGSYQGLVSQDLTYHNQKEYFLPDTLDEDLAEWLGLVWGDGSMVENDSARFVSLQIDEKDLDLKNHFEMLSKKLFGEQCNFVISKQETDGKSFSVRLTGATQILNWFRKNDLYKPKDEFYIPIKIKNSPKSVRAAFLRGLFETDGTVEVSGHNTVYSVHKRLIQDVQQVLFQLGIKNHIGCSKKTKEDSYTDNNIYSTTISTFEGRRLFLEEIGYISGRKKKLCLEGTPIEKPSAANEKSWPLPYFEDELETTLEMLTRDKTKGTLDLEAHNRLRNSVRRNISKRQTDSYVLNKRKAQQLVEEYPSFFNDTPLYELAYTNMLYCTARVEQDEATRVFDICVPDGHSYLVSSIVTHNSGGKSRRAAKMAILNIEHPDIIDFIESKAKEERKAWALIDAGYDGSLNGEAYNTVAFQNQNNSVRVSDDFMQAVVKDEDFYTKFVKNNQPCEKMKARNLLKKIAEMAYFCGEPGIQFHNTMNEWHTCPASGTIEASNPCGEFVFLNDSACNLASINLLKFLKVDGTFDVEGFLHTINLFIIAQEVFVENASYPTVEIEKNSHKYRPLGLGYANLGALLMAEGLPYDSNEGRAYAAAISALMTAKAYSTSADLARSIAPFDEYVKNKIPMLKVLEKHKAAAHDYLDKLKNTKENENSNTFELLSAAATIFENNLNEGNKYGFRNAQVTLLAPTGTIGFMMDCDSTGVEPCMALVAVKKTSDGGEMAIVTRVVGRGLRKLGYNAEQIKDILDFLKKEYGIEGAPHLQEKHYSAFACAFGSDPKNVISNMGHVKMMSAIQPFLSGAISKTVNLTSDVTEEQIFDIYVEAWKLGLKSITVYRDGSKKVQPMNMKKEKEEKKNSTDQNIGRAFRKKLPDRRPALTHKFNISSHEGYITVGLYPDTMHPGEIFIKMAKEGSTISGLMDTIATQTSIMLQYGVPLDTLVEKFSYMKFEPAGFTNNPDIRIADSITDYIYRWLGKEFLDKDIAPPETIAVKKEVVVEEKKVDKKKSIIFGPPCSCGTMMTRTGCSYTCPRCGKTTGGCS